MARLKKLNVQNEKHIFQHAFKHAFVLVKTVLFAVYFGLLLWMFLTPNYLWLDEARYAWLSVNWSWFRDVWYTFPFGLGFLQSIVLNIVNNQYSVKIVSFLASVEVVIVYFKFIERLRNIDKEGLFDDVGQIIMLAMLIFCYPLWRYAVEFNQYAVDLFVQILLIYFASFLFDAGKDVGKYKTKDNRIVQFGVLSAIVVWFSRPAIYTIAGIYVTYFLLFVYKRLKKFGLKKLQLEKMLKKNFLSFFDVDFLNMLKSGILVAISWITLYILRARVVINSGALSGYWEDAMGFSFVVHNITKIVQEPFASTLHLASLWWLFFGAVILGLMFLHKNRLTWLGLTLTLPSIITLFSTALGRFPWKGRVLNFLTLHYVLLAGFGLVFLGQILQVIVKNLLDNKNVGRSRKKTSSNHLLNVCILNICKILPYILFVGVFSGYLWNTIVVQVYANNWGNGGFGQIAKEYGHEIFDNSSIKWILMWGQYEYDFYGKCNKNLDENKCKNVLFFPYHKRGGYINPEEFAQIVKTQALTHTKDSKKLELWLISTHTNKTRVEKMKKLCKILASSDNITLEKQIIIRDAYACKLRFE